LRAPSSSGDFRPDSHSAPFRFDNRLIGQDRFLVIAPAPEWFVATERLRLREFTRDDLDTLHAMVADEEQMTFYPRPKTRDEAAAWLDRNLRIYAEHGFGFWLVASLTTSEFVGYCGIRPRPVDGAAEIEIGWHMKKTWWNRGIATEAAAAARDLAFGRFGLGRLVAVIHPDHVASRRVAEKIAMRAERTTVLDGDYPAVVYALER
jgi:RimJ/RimL family protein N-acetyltransferase